MERRVNDIEMFSGKGAACASIGGSAHAVTIAQMMMADMGLSNQDVARGSNLAAQSISTGVSFDTGYGR